MINVIDTLARKKVSTPTGRAQGLLTSADGAINTRVSKYEISAGKILTIQPGDLPKLVFILEGSSATINLISAQGETQTYAAGKGCGVYMEPGEAAEISANKSDITIFFLRVRKHTGKLSGLKPSVTATGFFFDEKFLPVLVDERGIRRRTFFVNKGVGLSSSWDMQFGRMIYLPSAYSPRHVHKPTATNPAGAEHFYFIEKGTGEVKYDGGNLWVCPGSLVLIPAGEWHQLVASATGLNYYEFQAPFDFDTTMDADPLGKNWYIEGTDDGTGHPVLWVQS